jgi:2,3-bisphosphoglycerate-independent phosphoglycerate mutase
MGNSEVGHLNIGAGRLVLQDFLRINRSIDRGDFFRKDALMSAIRRSAAQGSTLHLLGLLSDGGVHSHIDHLLALLEMAKEAGVNRVTMHAFLDGRDVPPRSALEYVRLLEERTSGGAGYIRTIAGRYYAMDRDRRWERTRLSYDAIVKGEGPLVQSAEQAVLDSYRDGLDDEFLVPRVVGEPRPMSPDDTVIFFNFRPDRPRQLTQALVSGQFGEFDRGEDPPLPYMVTMTEYDPRFGLPVAFPPEKVRNVLADVLSGHGLRQIHIAETEKYAHVTYFFNGGVEEPKVGEDRVLIPSPSVATYDLKPEMSAREVADETIRRIESGVYDFIVMNFANGDMVGHTGFFDAAVKAVEAVDENLGRVLRALSSAGGGAFVTSDHGNADEMGETGSPCTAHSLARVPFIDVTGAAEELRDDGTLGDVSPTVLEAMDLPQPAEMTGRSLYTRARCVNEKSTRKPIR